MISPILKSLTDGFGVIGKMYTLPASSVPLALNVRSTPAAFPNLSALIVSRSFSLHPEPGETTSIDAAQLASSVTLNSAPSPLPVVVADKNVYV